MTAAVPGGVAPPSIPSTVSLEPLGRRFHVHLGGVGLANLADGIVAAGVPLIAISLTRSPGQIALLSVALWLPWLLLGLLAGVLVDRVDRRRLQVSAMSVRVLVLALLAAAAFTDRLSMPLLIGAVLLYGVTEVFVDLAAGALVPAIAPRSRLSAANGRVLATQQVCGTFVGALAGSVLLLLGHGWVIAVPAGLCVGFVLLIGTGLRGDYRIPRTGKVDVVHEVTEGARFLLGHRVLRPLLITAGVMNMANTGYFAVFVLWVVGPGSAVGLDPEHFPLLVAVIAVGAVLGSLVTERLLRRVQEVPLMFTCWGVNSLVLLIPVLWPQWAPIGAAMFVLGFTNTIGNVLSQTIRQRLVPARLLGRVGGAGRTIGYGLMPVGALLGGLVAEAWGLASVFVGAAILCLLAVGYVVARVSQGTVAAHETAS